MKKIRLLEIIHEEITSALTEIPDFGGRYDSQVADKHGEEDTLQAATDEIVELSEQFSDCDEQRLVVNNKELEVPEEMKKYLNDMLNDDIAVS